MAAFDLVLRKVAFLAGHLLWLTDAKGREHVYDMVTTSAAQVLGLRDHRLGPGGRADLVILEAPDVLEALRAHARPRCTLRSGRALSRHPPSRRATDV